MDEGGLTIAAVPPLLVDVLWKQIEPHVDLAIAESFGDLDKERLKIRLKDGSEMILAVCDGPEIIATCLVTVSTLDTGRRVLFVPGIGGERMSEWLDDGLEMLRKMAADFGCEGIRACGRAGWSRAIPSAKALHTIVEF